MTSVLVLGANGQLTRDTATALPPMPRPSPQGRRKPPSHSGLSARPAQNVRVASAFAPLSEEEMAEVRAAARS